MITQKQAEEIVKRYSPTTKVSVHNTDSMDGIYLQKTDTIIIAHNWSVAGLLHEITHAVLILEDGRVGHDGVFADRFTKIVGDYYEEQIERLQEQLKEANAIIEDMRPFIQASMSRQTFTRILNYEDKCGVK